MSGSSGSEGAICRPNFGVVGRRRRRRIAITGGVAAVVMVGWMIVLGLGWEWRLLVFLPASVACVTELQVTRHTCIGHAVTGHVEDDDGVPRTKADAALVQASRRVALTILRDGVAGAAVCSLLAASTALWT